VTNFTSQLPQVAEEIPGDGDGTKDSDLCGARIALKIGIQSAINVALHTNSVPVLTELTVVNWTGTPLNAITIDLSCDVPAIRPKTWHLAQIGSGQARSVSDLDIGLNGPWLSALTEGVRAAVTVTARSGDEVL
jgi:hypothetical protein